MKCKCGERLITRSGDVVKLRARIVRFDATGGAAHVVCPACKDEIPIPLTLDPSVVPIETKLVIERGFFRSKNGSQRSKVTERLP